MHDLRGSALATILLMTAAAIAGPHPAQAQVSFGVGVVVDFAPPPLPVYDQPPIPGPDYIWVPGYWAWDDDDYDYYWVPGTWVLAPEPGLLWTPGWWGWEDGGYGFHDGYWAPEVGYYGGVVYGFGYTGDDYEGGYWRDNHFFYNRNVTKITNVNITNVYNKTVVINHGATASFNGPGGITARPTPQQMAAAKLRHVPPTPQQVQHVSIAKTTPVLHAAANHGAPPVAATAKPGALNGPEVVAARPGGAYHPPPAALARQAQAKVSHGAPPPPQTVRDRAPGAGGPNVPAHEPAPLAMPPEPHQPPAPAEKAARPAAPEERAPRAQPAPPEAIHAEHAPPPPPVEHRAAPPPPAERMAPPPSIEHRAPPMPPPPRPPEPRPPPPEHHEPKPDDKKPPG
jgi:hypothetical protein